MIIIALSRNTFCLLTESDSSDLKQIKMELILQFSNCFLI